ncbi:hypothetical protein MKX01_036379 [Papaver californicum]|nr:hypothetical protein MKX01_036379 [Papaver californicum]
MLTCNSKSKEATNTSTTQITSAVHKASNRLDTKSFNCGGDGHMTYSCPHKQVNFIEDDVDEDILGEPRYDESEGEDLVEKTDLMPVRGENLVVRRILTCPKIDDEEEDWRRKSIFAHKFSVEVRFAN